MGMRRSSGGEKRSYYPRILEWKKVVKEALWKGRIGYLQILIGREGGENTRTKACSGNRRRRQSGGGSSLIPQKKRGQVGFYLAPEKSKQSFGTPVRKEGGQEVDCYESPQRPSSKRV